MSNGPYECVGKSKKLKLPSTRIYITAEKWMVTIFEKRGVHVRALRQHLVRPKDEIAVEEKCGVIYNIKCKDCDAKYFGDKRNGH